MAEAQRTTPEAPQPLRFGTYLGLAAVVLLGAVLRLGAARGDLWLDELWSQALAEQAGSVLRVFTSLHHDNNHYLNTLYLLFLGPDASPLLWRLPAVVAGMGTLALAAWRPLGGGRAEALVRVVLFSFSYVLVLYSSEARGYGLAVFFAVAAYQALDLYLATRRRRWAACFAAAAVLGLVSHLTFAACLDALALWTALEVVRTRRQSPIDPWAVAALAVPWLVLAALAVVDLRWVQVGGGPEYEMLGVIRQTLRATFGAPHGPWELLVVPLLAAAAWEVWGMARRGETRWVFFVVVLVLFPAATALKRPGFVAPRYFLLCVPFLLMLSALALGRAWSQGRAARALCTVALALFCAGSFVNLYRLETLGRGSYRAALTYLLAASPAGQVTVGSDNDFRNAVVAGFYAPRLPGGDRLAYFPQDRWSLGPPLWILTHDFEDTPAPLPYVVLPGGYRYTLEKTYPYGGLSGWNWHLYRLGGGEAR